MSFSDDFDYINLVKCNRNFIFDHFKNQLKTAPHEAFENICSDDAGYVLELCKQIHEETNLPVRFV